MQEHKPKANTLGRWKQKERCPREDKRPTHPNTQESHKNNKPESIMYMHRTCRVKKRKKKLCTNKTKLNLK